MAIKNKFNPYKATEQPTFQVDAHEQIPFPFFKIIAAPACVFLLGSLFSSLPMLLHRQGSASNLPSHDADIGKGIFIFFSLLLAFLCGVVSLLGWLAWERKRNDEFPVESDRKHAA